MRPHLTYILTTCILTSCDCIQRATGVVIDRQSKAPIENVGLGKFEKPDTSNSYSRRIYTDTKGRFDYRSTSGGFRKCPDLTLYFDKPGYRTAKMTFESFSQNDSVFLERLSFNRDSSKIITLLDFNKQIEDCISWLNSKELRDISDEQHIQIMLCLNTIFMRDFKGGQYDELRKISEGKNYARDIIEVYTEWTPNRGMGYYFPKLNMELYGTPMLYAIYNVI